MSTPICKNGSSGCTCGLARDIELMTEIGSAVNKFIGEPICHLCVRNQLLLAAAHMHMAATELYAADHAKARVVEGERLYAAFASAAFDQMEQVLNHKVREGDITLHRRQSDAKH